jgi:hypothetical protein
MYRRAAISPSRRPRSHDGPSRSRRADREHSSMRFAPQFRSTEVEGHIDRRGGLKIADSASRALLELVVEGDRHEGESVSLRSPATRVAGLRRVKAAVRIFRSGEAIGCAVLRVLGVEAGPDDSGGWSREGSRTRRRRRRSRFRGSSREGSGGTSHQAPPSRPWPRLVPRSLHHGHGSESPRARRAVPRDGDGRSPRTGSISFSQEYPGSYLSDPEVYASDDKLVLRLRIRGPE